MRTISPYNRGFRRPGNTVSRGGDKLLGLGAKGIPQSGRQFFKGDREIQRGGGQATEGCQNFNDQWSAVLDWLASQRAEKLVFVGDTGGLLVPLMGSYGEQAAFAGRGE